MKSEHRHELKTNDLGRIALESWQSVESWSREHKNHLILSAVVVVVLVVGAIVWSQSSGSASTAGWGEIAAARTAEDFANIADNYPGTAAAAWAKLKEAESYLRDGVQFSLTDRASSVSDLVRAQESFEQVLAERAATAAVRERALFGLARCKEALCDGDTEGAVKAYDRFVAEFPESLYAPLAKQRIEQLKTGSVQEFYAWFHKQNPKPPDREQPRDGTEPGGSETNPLDPDLTFPSNDSPGGPSLTSPFPPIGEPAGGETDDDKPPDSTDSTETGPEEEAADPDDSAAEGEAAGNEQPAPNSAGEEDTDRRNDSTDPGGFASVRRPGGTGEAPAEPVAHRDSSDPR